MLRGRDCMSKTKPGDQMMTVEDTTEVVMLMEQTSGPILEDQTTRAPE
jgi:hypothetical protein